MVAEYHAPTPIHSTARTHDHHATLRNGPHELSVSLELIDPETARRYLDANPRNRSITESQLQKIQSDIAAGDYVLNGATVVIDWDGNLSDGQHRCLAVIREGRPIWTLVVRGVEPIVAQDTTDNTRKRTLHTQLQMRGERNCKNLTAAVNAYWQLLSGGVSSSGGRYPTVREGLRFLEEHPGLRQSVIVGNRVAERPLRYPSGTAAALHYGQMQIDEDDAHAFWERLAHGNDIGPGNALFALREKVMSNAARKPGTPGLTNKYIAAVTIKAWNSWRRGDDVRMLKWRAGGANPEPFPSLFGDDGEGRR